LGGGHLLAAIAFHTIENVRAYAMRMYPAEDIFLALDIAQHYRDRLFLAIVI
jgi:hypothetical protein